LVNYVRVDYRKGTDIDALGVNGSIRYQFMPPTVLAKSKGVYKAPVAAVVPPYNWGTLCRRLCRGLLGNRQVDHDLRSQ